MAFNHRKLSSGSVSTNISMNCELYCDPTKNKDGFCSTLCLSRCFETCHNSIASLIPPPDPSTAPPSDDDPSKARLRLFLIISLSILAATFFLFCCYTIYKYYKNRVISRRRSSQPLQEETHDEDFLDEDHGPVLDHPIWYIRTVGLQPSIIDSITVCKYKKGEGLVEGTDCSVCLSEFQEDETLRLLPKCNHAFHIPCIDTWLRSHTNCPMCRAGIVTSPAGLPAPATEQSVEDSVVREETQAVISESSGEFRREREDGDCELEMGTEQEGELQVENGGKSPETSKEELVDTDLEVQPVRRSVSMDSLSASMVSAAIANAHSGESAENSGAQLAKVKELNMGIVPKKVDFNQNLLRLVGGSSIGRSLQKRPILMKRSLSCSGKVLLSRYSRSRNSLLPS